MTRRQDAALVTLFRTITPLSAKIFVSDAIGEGGARVAAPYVVVHPADGTDAALRLTGPSLTQNPRWTIHSVGMTADQAKWAAELVKGKLIVNGFGISLTISGERPGAFWYSSPIPIQRDDDVSPSLFFHVAECGFASDIQQ